MRLKSMLLAMFVLMSAKLTLAQETRFTIKKVKAVTPNVDRFLDQNDNAFATIFCREDAASVMVVDGSKLDGKNFMFPNTVICNQARLDARNNAGKCKLELIVNTNDMSAEVKGQSCP